jgi:hypothetical protein
MTDRQPNAWATGLSLFAGSLLIVVGVFHVLEGIVAVANDNFFVKAPNYTFNIDTTAYGWTHILMGVILVLVGCGILAGQTWARYTGIFFASLSMIENFLFVPYYPVWSIVLIALDVAVVWALAKPTYENG